jgi:predicted small metal-binding protein
MSYEYSCAGAGAVTCGCKVTANSEEELREILAAHLAKKHKVPTPNETLMDHLVASARHSGDGPRHPASA